MPNVLQRHSILRQILITMVAFVLTWPFVNLGLGTDPDSALAWLFNQIPAQWPDAPGPFIFPHGPLAFLVYPLNVSLNLWWFFLYVFAAKFSIVWSFDIVLANRSQRYQRILGWLACVALLVFTSSQHLGYIAVAALAIAFLEYRKSAVAMAISVWVALSLLIKADLAVYALATVVVLALDMAWKKEWKTLGRAIVVGLVVLVSLWLLIHGITALTEIFTYLKGSWVLLFGNEAAMTLVDDRISLLLIGWLLILLSISFFFKKQNEWTLWLVLVIPLMASWKHGIVRHDLYHAWAFQLHLIAFWSLLLLGIRRWSPMVLPLVAASVWIFHLAFAGAVKDYENRGWFRNGPMQWESLMAKFEPLDRSTVTLEGIQPEGEGMDVIPYDLFFVGANSAKPAIKPVVQTYAANTPYLDSLNATYFQNEGPKWLVWHADHRGDFTSIDSRSSWSDIPKTAQAIRSNYELFGIEKGAFIFKSGTERKVHETLLSREKVRAFEWNDFQVPNNAIVTANAKFEKTLTGNLQSLLLRSKPVYVQLRTKSGDQHTFRLHGNSEVQGIQLNPVSYIEHDSILFQEEVASWRFLFDTNAFQTEIEVVTSWEENQLHVRNAPEPRIIFQKELKDVDIQSYSSCSPISWKPDSFAQAMHDSTRFVQVYAHALIMHDTVPDAQLILEAWQGEEKIGNIAYLNTIMASVDGFIFDRTDLCLTAQEWQAVTEVKAHVYNGAARHPIRLDQLTLGIIHSSPQKTGYGHHSAD